MPHPCLPWSSFKALFYHIVKWWVILTFPKHSRCHNGIIAEQSPNQQQLCHNNSTEKVCLLLIKKWRTETQRNHASRPAKSLQILGWQTGSLNLSLIYYLHNSQPITVMTTTKWWSALIFKHFCLRVGQQKPFAAQSKAARGMKLHVIVSRGCYNMGQLEALNCTSVLEHMGRESTHCKSLLQGKWCCTEEDFAERLVQKCRTRKESQNPFCMRGNTLQRSALTAGLSNAQKRISRRERVLQSTQEISGSMRIVAAPSPKRFNWCKNTRN